MDAFAASWASVETETIWCEAMQAAADFSFVSVGKTMTRVEDNAPDVIGVGELPLMPISDVERGRG